MFEGAFRVRGSRGLGAQGLGFQGVVEGVGPSGSRRVGRIAQETWLREYCSAFWVWNSAFGF